MDLSSIQLGHWLMVAGFGLVVAGFLGLMFSRKSPLPDSDLEPTVPRPQLRPLPRLMDSSRHADNG